MATKATSPRHDFNRRFDIQITKENAWFQRKVSLKFCYWILFFKDKGWILKMYIYWYHEDTSRVKIVIVFIIIWRFLHKSGDKSENLSVTSPIFFKKNQAMSMATRWRCHRRAKAIQRFLHPALNSFFPQDEFFDAGCFGNDQCDIDNYGCSAYGQIAESINIGDHRCGSAQWCRMVVLLATNNSKISTEIWVIFFNYLKIGFLLDFCVDEDISCMIRPVKRLKILFFSPWRGEKNGPKPVFGQKRPKWALF